MIHLGISGSGVCSNEDARVAFEVGRLAAEAGAVVITGGLGGVMEAACEGARSAGGVTVGLLPGSDRSEANPYVTVAIPTGIGEMRNALLVRASDAIIAIGGEFGTLSEVALALKLGVPVVGIGTWSLEREGMTLDPILRATDAADAMRLALMQAKRG